RDGTYVDGTVGGGGHAEKICEHLGPRGRLIGMDADADAIEASHIRLERFGSRVTLIRANFRDIVSELGTRGVQQLAGILLDLGVSSHQIDQAERGFSFRADGKFDMRMDTRRPVSAHEVINDYSQERLETILREYGEERAARRIVRSLIRARPVVTAGELNGVIERCVGRRYLTKSLARVYQAIRIEVNGELESLREALVSVPDLLHPGGRCVVIAYHSLEDRIVKEFFREEAADRIPSHNKFVPDLPRSPRLEILTRKPVTATEQEIARNGRARSAKLRAAERR
ncbi:MAG TPA: 16S rRNA (cytosine(1402)-N(4))-methyltransferase RsmH, partial [Bacteroidota bacterium]